jgi:uncharacterized membrane protein
MQISALAMIVTIPGFFVILLAGLIYLILYKNAINKRLNSGELYNEPAKKPMMTPIKFMAILFSIYLAVVLIIIVLNAIFMFNPKNEKYQVNEVETFPVVYSCESNETSGTIYEDLSADEDISGYIRKVKTDGDFRFVYYMRSDEWDGDGLFPEIIIYAEYTGDMDGFKTGYEMSAKNSDGEIGNSTCDSSAGGTWFSANLFWADTELDIDYMLFSDKSSQQAMNDSDGEYAKYAEKTGEFTITGAKLPIYDDVED